MPPDPNSLSTFLKYDSPHPQAHLSLFLAIVSQTSAISRFRHVHWDIRPKQLQIHMVPLPLQIHSPHPENDHGLKLILLQLANLHLSLMYNAETALRNPTAYQMLPC